MSDADAESEVPEEDLAETWAEGLEGQAKDIVESDAKRQCIQAGPGTGKSYCMTRRLLRLIQQKKVAPAQVLAVTFTRTAATDLKKSLTGILGEKYKNFRASTLHSLCFNIVEDQSFLDIRGRHARFLLSVTKAGCLNFEAAPMLADLKAENSEYQGAREQTKKIKQFEAMWAKRQEDPLGAPGGGIEAAYGTSLLNWLKFHKCMMVGELIKEAYEFMSSEPDSPWRTKFKAVLVDEYQDLNKLDQATIDLLCENTEGISSVVGDLDQSIYSFRCAHPEGLKDYAARESVESLTMEKSRRCPTSVLTAAQTLIQQNTKKADQYPTPLPGAKAGEISVRRWPNREAEISGIIDFVKHCKLNGVETGEILVMVPSRVIGKDIKQALRGENIDAHSYFAEEQLEEVGAQKAFTLLTLLAYPKDRVSLRCWLGGWTSSQRVGNYSKLRTYCVQNNAEPIEVLEKLASGEFTMSGTAKLVESYNDLKAQLNALKDLKGRALFETLFLPTEDWSDDFEVLVADALTDDTAASDLHDLLVEGITQPVMPTEVDYVRIMSLHKSKGLTAKASVIGGAIEGLIPRPHDPVKSFLTEPEHMEEQRRLFYVAMTRSTDYLLISSSRLVASPFEFGPPISGEWEPGGAGYRTVVSSFVTGLGTPTLPSATSTNAFP